VFVTSRTLPDVKCPYLDEPSGVASVLWPAI